MIRIKKLDFTYAHGGPGKVLDNIWLEIPKGRYLLVCGRSGSGKSTLCRTFNGLIPHFYPGKLAGTVVVDGKVTSQTPVEALFDKVAMVFQNPEAQLFNSTVRGEMAFGLESLGLAPELIRQRISKVAEQLEIADLLDKDPRRLSGGQQHLVTLAAMVALKPGVLVLDEPFANLDARHAGALRRILKKLKAEGLAIVVCEHRLRPTLPDADQVVVIDGGQIVLQGPVQQVLRQDLEQYGLELPLAVKLSRRLGLETIHTAMENLLECIDRSCLTTIKTGTGPEQNHVPGNQVLETRHLEGGRGGKVVLKNIDLQIAAGTCVAIVGANGAGKTTLARHLNGLARPVKGTVMLHGNDVTSTKASLRAQHIGTVFQNPADQFFKLKVRDEIGVAPRALGCFDQHWIDSLARHFQLDHLMERAPFRLSAGEKKRVAFAAALAAKPSVLILDEPTAGQDADFRAALKHKIKELVKQKRTVVIITHDLEFVHGLASRWIVMAGGRIVRQGKPETLMADQKLMDRTGLKPTERFLWQNRGAQRC